MITRWIGMVLGLFSVRAYCQRYVHFHVLRSHWLKVKDVRFGCDTRTNCHAQLSIKIWFHIVPVSGTSRTEGKTGIVKIGFRRSWRYLTKGFLSSCLHGCVYVP